MECNFKTSPGINLEELINAMKTLKIDNTVQKVWTEPSEYITTSVTSEDR